MLRSSVACFALAAVGSAFECNHKFKSPAMHYDLSLLMSEHVDYFANDTYYDLGRPFQYFFNVCSNTREDALPFPGGDRSLCQHGTEHESEAAAYQIVGATANNPDGECFRLGDASDMEWKLLEEGQLTGVQLKYRGGDQCGAGPATRSFAINFVCVEEATSVRPPVSKVEEGYDDSKCEYEVTVETIYACPTQCVSQNTRTSCAKHGICGIDIDADAARCFCNQAWTGEYCQESRAEAKRDANKQKPEPSSSGVGTTILVFFLLFAVIGAVAYCQRAAISKWLLWRLSNQQYAGPRGGDDVLGPGALSEEF
jgi:hypothetical protein